MNYCISSSLKGGSIKSRATGWFVSNGSSSLYTPDVNDAFKGRERCESRCGLTSYEGFWIEEYNNKGE